MITVIFYFFFAWFAPFIHWTVLLTERNLLSLKFKDFLLCLHFNVKNKKRLKKKVKHSIIFVAYYFLQALKLLGIWPKKLIVKYLVWYFLDSKRYISKTSKSHSLFTLLCFFIYFLLFSKIFCEFIMVKKRKRFLLKMHHIIILVYKKNGMQYYKISSQLILAEFFGQLYKKISYNPNLSHKSK